MWPRELSAEPCAWQRLQNKVTGQLESSSSSEGWSNPPEHKCGLSKAKIHGTTTMFCFYRVNILYASVHIHSSSYLSIYFSQPQCQ